VCKSALVCVKSALVCVKSALVCVKSALVFVSFPAQNVEVFENIRDKSHSLDDWEHGCPILPQPEGTKSASHRRAMYRCDFHESPLVKPFFCISAPHRDLLIGGWTDKLVHRGWQTLGIIVLTPARDASHRRGAETTRQFAGLGARGVTKTTTGTNTSKLPVPGLPAHAQSTRQHNCCRPDGRNHGHITYQLDPRRTYTAATMESYAPCNHTNTAAST